MQHVLCQGRTVPLYHIDQTTKHGPYTAARNYLLDLFASYPEKFGYTPKSGPRVLQAPSCWFRGGAYSFLERGFNYAACKKGIVIFRNRETGEPFLAESFHVAADTMTRFLVLDLDNHDPTALSTGCHLELVKLLQDRMADLLKAVGGTCSFYQYRQIEPTGIQIWVVLPRQQNHVYLHNTARSFLLSLDQNGLNERLFQAGLPTLNNIEILPTDKMISMPGSYGKTVFTAKELTINDSRFDCVGLFRHIVAQRPAGKVYRRYRELALVRSFDDDKVTKPATRLTAAQPLHDNTYWSHLKYIALNGVFRQDNLHDDYLEPLAQALLFREFVHCDDKVARTASCLTLWISKKHNGLVTRINNNEMHLVSDQIRSTIKTLQKKTNTKVREYFSQMVKNDVRYPHRIESLASIMEAEPNTPPSSLIDCIKGGVSSSAEVKTTSQNKPLPLLIKMPATLLGRLRDYSKSRIRKGTATKRFIAFSHRLISDIATKGSKEISKTRLLQLAGKKPGHDTTFLKKWKNHLVKAGIIEKGWERNIIRGIRSSKYTLTEWVMGELGTIAVNAPEPQIEPLLNKTAPARGEASEAV